MDNSNLNTLLDAAAARVNTPRQKVYITNDIDHFISKTKELSIGDVIIHKRFGVINDTYVYDGTNTLAKLDNDSNNLAHKEKIKMIPKVCKCCGAPMNNNSNICEYCGVNYE